LIKKTALIVLVLAIFLTGIFWPVFARRGGSEIQFGATVYRVEGSDVYATVDEQGFVPFAEGLPEQIVFDTGLLDTQLKPGDFFRGSYISGSVNGQRVRVVSAHIPPED
jgi:hypothetical protein